MSASTTNLVRLLLRGSLRRVERYATGAEALQRAVLQRLVSLARDTEWGREHGYAKVKGYDDYRRLCPVGSYDSLKPLIERMRRGESDVLWRGRVRWYAKSSGTVSERSKFLPVSREALADTHYRGGTDAVALYLRNNPQSRMFEGKSLILGGSHGSDFTGDLSAILLENASSFVNHFRVPGKQTALLPDFEQKRERIARETLGQRVTNISGVPSWMLSVLTRVVELSGKRTLGEVWPGLEVFFHGGVAFTPYRQQYEQLIGNEAMRYVETYNASEGFFGIQDDPRDRAMSLMVDYGVFYEFIPLGELLKGSLEAVPLWGVSEGVDYAMLISTSGGLWRYVIGDTVRFTSLNPYKFVITGRTRSFINAFGEELIVDNAEKGLAEACLETGAQVREYTAAPVYMDERGRCRHQWLIEFSKTPDDVGRFALLLDEALQRLNSDYEAKRSKSITLQPLEVIVARKGLFDDWLKSEGKLGGQHKVPRLSNDRTVMERILKLTQTL
ncbi:MAG: GH3 auxin-responsive promoter family protein [Prevotellaceae bacterium]|nr:GH3 auxin-responsive promoter family protein [Prevotellaceae bacterium]